MYIVNPTRFLFWVVVLLINHESAMGRQYNGFDLHDVSIPLNEIHHGGPDRDGIPALSQPKFVSAEQVDWIDPEARVLALNLLGEAKAYPVSILNWHEIVNDQINGRSLVVTYCPLCGSGMAFSAQVEGKLLDFGVSGLLYNSDVLLYDRETESLWSQLMRQAISGPMQGQELQMLPLEHTTWGRWREMQPKTLVLSKDTGYKRNYHSDPYAGYQDDAGTYFPVSQLDPRYHPKQQTLGLEIQDRYKAYPFVELDKAGGRISDSLAGQDYQVLYDRASHSAWVVDARGSKMPSVIVYWFAWMAFYPDSAVYVQHEQGSK